MDEVLTKKRSRSVVGQSGRQAKEKALRTTRQPEPLFPPPGPPPEASRAALVEELQLEERRAKLIYGLPHLHGWKFYPWAREFFESRNKQNFLCAANQISKSSTQIRKCVDWATDQTKWPQLWARAPKQFWYLYPSQEVVNIEFALKWEPEFLPRGEFKADPLYGWEAIRNSKRDVLGIRFNSGVHIFFKTYSKNVQNLQTGTVDCIFCFVAGTQIETPVGPRAIETLVPGDLVLSKDGWAPVGKVSSREASVRTYTFANGTQLTGTPEHPIATENRGWVALGELLPTDRCITVPVWQPKLWQMLNWFFSGGFSTGGVRRPPILGNGTILSGPRGKLFTRLFGKPTISKLCRRIALSITGMAYRSTIGCRISSALPAQNTPPTISGRNGENGACTPAFASTVADTSSRGVQSSPSLGIARCLAAGRATLKKLSVFDAEKKKTCGKTNRKNTALISVSTEPSTSRVFNLQVEDSRTYFASGILTHNCDEELPEKLYSELVNRLNATDGYFHMVFTATLGQDLWRKTMEPASNETENFPAAAKWTVSLYEAMFYDDGSASHWTEARIEAIKAKCATHQEYLKRVMGRFILLSGRKYPTFDIKRHMRPRAAIPFNWLVYSGVDCGSGGEKNHPAAMVFVAVSPDCRAARVFLGWRGDKIETTDSDILNKYRELKAGGKLNPVLEQYDWSAKDFEIIARGMGENFIKAEKSHEKGEAILNTLFKNDMMLIYDDPELAKLAGELATLLHSTNKTKAADDFIDALRYAVARVPWDFSGLIGLPSDFLEEVPEAPMTEEQRIDAERKRAFDAHPEEFQTVEEEFADANEDYG